jgi:integrase
MIDELYADYMDIPLFEMWMREKKNLAASTIYYYRKAAIRFLAKNPNLMNAQLYNDFLIDVSIRKRCSYYYAALRSFLEFKIPDINMRRKVLDGILKPPERMDIKKERTYLSEKDILSVVNNISEPRYAIIALIQSLTGVRAGDVMRLKRGEIVSEEYKGKPVLRLNITGKRAKRNVVFIHDPIAQDIVMNFITTYNSLTSHYFLTFKRRKGREEAIKNEFKLLRNCYDSYLVELKKALEAAHVDKTKFASHDFRRCFARRAWEKWMDLTVLQKLLGHQNINTTVRYLQSSGLQNIDYSYEMQS